MTCRCYVCGTPVDPASGVDLRSPRCQTCEPVKDHVISMRTDGAVCACGWSTDIPSRLPNAREYACKVHWRGVIEAAS